MLFQRLILRQFRWQFIRSITTSGVQVEFRDGLANITVPLPSRGESCVFQVKKERKKQHRQLIIVSSD